MATEESRIRREEHSRAPLAFISSPYRGETDEEIFENVKRARAMCRWAMDRGYAPFASHLIYTQFLDEDVQEERDLGIGIGRAFMKQSSYIVLYRGSDSDGTNEDKFLAEKNELAHIFVLDDKDLEPYYEKNTFLPPWVKE